LTAELLLRIAFGDRALKQAIADAKSRAKLVESWIKNLKALIEKGWSITPDPQTYPMSYWVETGKSSLFNEIPDDPDSAVEFWAKDANENIGNRLTDRTRRERGSFNLLLNGRLWIQPAKTIADRLDAIDEARWGSSKDAELRSQLATTTPSKANHSISSLNRIKEIQSGEHLKQLRITKGISQAELANQIGRSLSWIKMVETGKRKIQPQDHATLLTVFN